MGSGLAEKEQDGGCCRRVDDTLQQLRGRIAALVAGGLTLSHPEVVELSQELDALVLGVMRQLSR